MSTNRPRAKHDEAYKLLFSNAAVVEGLLDKIVPGLLDRIEPQSLRKISTSFVKPDGLDQRHCDVVWTARFLKPNRPPLYIPLEFQSAPLANMAFRVHEYVTLLLREAEIQGDLGPAGRPPITAPFVIYNGLARWNSATDLVVRSRNPRCIRPAMHPGWTAR